nr:unnamed protein product [Callosobruchus chinensis]
MVEFNASRTRYCTLSNNRCPSEHSVLMNSEALLRSHSFKLVGVSIWHEHVSSIATAAGKKLGYLFRARKYFSPSNFLTLYKAPIRPSLEYCSHIWGAAAPTTLSILDVVQRRAIRLIESLTTYGAEIWELDKKERNKMLSLEMDFWIRSSRHSKLDHVRNDRIREIMDVQETILDTIGSKRLTWYGHLERMANNRWPKKVWEWTPPGRRKRGRPPRSLEKDVEEEMLRGLQEGDWWNRDLWRLRSEKRRQL